MDYITCDAAFPSERDKIETSIAASTYVGQNDWHLVSHLAIQPASSVATIRTLRLVSC